MDTHNTVQHNRIAWKAPTCDNGVFQGDNQAMLHTERTQSTWWKTGRRGDQRGLSGEEWVVPTWVSKRYAGDGAQIDALSIRCPMQLGLKRAGRKEGSLSSCTGHPHIHTRMYSHIHYSTYQTYCRWTSGIDKSVFYMFLQQFTWQTPPICLCCSEYSRSTQTVLYLLLLFDIL